MGKEKKTPITIDGKEYIYEELSEKQQLLVNHVEDLSRKIRSAEFNLDQLLVGKNAFIEKLKEELK
jgi:hypothetical protein